MLPGGAEKEQRLGTFGEASAQEAKLKDFGRLHLVIEAGNVFHFSMIFNCANTELTFSPASRKSPINFSKLLIDTFSTVNMFWKEKCIRIYVFSSEWLKL